MANRRDWGAGSIYRRARDGRWVGEITVPDTGRRKSVICATKQEAQRRLAQLRREIEQGLTPGDPRQTVEQYLASWLETIKPTMSDSAWLRHEQFCRLQIVPAIGAVKLASLSAQHVQTLYASLLSSGLSSTTVHHAHATLHKALKGAMRLGLVARNVTEMVEVPRMRHHEMHVLSVTQARQFVIACEGERLAALLILAITTGMRQGELIALHWKDVQIDGTRDGSLSVRWNLRYRNGVFTFKEPKTRRSRRRIALAAFAAEMLRAHRARQETEQAQAGDIWQENDLVFCTEAGTPLTANGALRSTYERVLRRADLPAIRFHDLRHTCATLLLGANVNPKVVSELLGHSSIAVTLDIYSHVMPDMQEDAAMTLAEMLSRGRETRKSVSLVRLPPVASEGADEGGNE
ncbi:MAG TPA: site-specific integrase [Ktedonobacterales bacterium]|nr:site-specific integrase [Ktedonobacterales bacterium]